MNNEYGDEHDQAEADVAEVIEDRHFSVPTTNAGQVSEAGHQGGLVTLVVNASNPVVQLLGRDYPRTAAYVLAVDAPVFLATSKENAQASIGPQVTAGAAAPLVSPSGYLPALVNYPWMNGDELWAGMIGSTPTRISVEVCRRLEQR